MPPLARWHFSSNCLLQCTLHMFWCCSHFCCGRSGNPAQHNAVQPNETQHNATQHNTAQHNTTQPIRTPHSPPAIPRRKDVDQIQDELVVEEEKGEETTFDVDDDLPGQGQFYCTPCARHFTDGPTKAKHLKAKLHKRRSAINIPVLCTDSICTVALTDTYWDHKGKSA